MSPRPRNPHLRLAAGATLALVVALAACGGDDDADPTSAAPAPATTTPPQPTPTTAAPAPATTAAAPTTALALTLPTKRSDIVPTAGDLPNGVYRFTETLEILEAAGEANPEPFIGEFVLKDGTAELHYFNLDSSPMAGEPPDTGGVYQVQGDLMIFATPPERAIPGTNGIVLLRWSLDGDTLTLEQIDDGRRDADFMAPWIRVGDAP